MKKLISSSEVVQSIHGDSGEWAVCAAAEADYDESDSRVVVELESFLRSIDELRGRGPPSAVAARQEPRDRAGAARRSQPGGARCFRELGAQSPSLHSTRALEKFGLTKPWRALHSTFNEFLCR
jgi:hypothetical protein